MGELAKCFFHFKESEDYGKHEFLLCQQCAGGPLLKFRTLVNFGFMLGVSV